MGGCYGTGYGYRSSCESSYDADSGNANIRKFLKSRNKSDLIKAYTQFMNSEASGFIAKLALAEGLKSVADIPKEFPEIEYEVKFDIQAAGTGKEPGIGDYLDAFDFPAAKTARFLKDPVNTNAVGVNSFIGDSLDERLVIIEKGGKIFLKEKGAVLPTSIGVEYEDVVIKRTEKRYEVSFDEALMKAQEILSTQGMAYQGRIRKEKGDAFILDTNDGRIYSFTITRAHLTKPGEKQESGIQRQLELEYAGYIPVLVGFEKNSEKHIIQGMVDLAKYVYVLYHDAPVKGWRMSLALTNERKYDFVKGQPRLEPEKLVLSLPEPLQAKVKVRKNGR